MLDLRAKNKSWSHEAALFHFSVSECYDYLPHKIFIVTLFSFITPELYTCFSLLFISLQEPFLSASFLFSAVQAKQVTTKYFQSVFVYNCLFCPLILFWHMNQTSHKKILSVILCLQLFVQVTGHSPKHKILNKIGIQSSPSPKL